jgi:tetratricopeptide (TPR) repeat protein
MPTAAHAADLELPDVDVSFEDPVRKKSQPAPGRNVAYAEALAERYQTQEYTLSTPQGREKRRRKLGTFKTTAILGVVCAIALVAYYGWTASRKARDIEIGKLLDQARELLEKDTYKSYRDAAALCNKILEMNSDSVAGHAYLAYVDAIRSGELGDGERIREESKKHLEAVKKLVDKHSHMIAAEVYLRYFGGDTQGAIDELVDVLKNEADSAFLNGVLGVILMQSGDLDGAKVSLDKARRIADRDARVNQMLAELFRRRGTGYESQAENSYGNALRYTPDHVPSILGYSMMLLTADRLDEAIKGADKVIAMGDNASPRQVAVAYAVKGSVLYGKGKGTDGASYEQKALGLDTSNPDIYDIIGQRKVRDGDLDGAAESFQRAISLDPRREMFYADLTHALLRKVGGAKQAIEALTAATSKLPDDPRIAKLLGDAYRVVNDFNQSLKWYEKALAFAKAKAGTDQTALDKGFPQAQLGLGRLYRQTGDTEQALRYFEEAKKEFLKAGGPGVADVNAEMGEMELARDPNGGKAVALFTAALQANPRQCEALWALGKMSFDRKVKDDAKRLLGTYALECSRAVHAAEATRLALSIK